MTGFNPCSMKSQTENISIQAQNQHQQPANSPQVIPELTNDEITLRNLKKNTLVYEDKVKKRVIYVFNYLEEVIKTNEGNTVLLNKESLLYLKANKKWKLIKHPYIFNYVNEILLNASYLYFGHVLLYFFYLILLYAYISTKDIRIAYLAFGIVSILIYMAFAKSNLQERKSANIFSLKFITIVFNWFISYFFTILTYICILIWLIVSISSYFVPGENKDVFLWWSQIIVILISWIQCLYVLKNSFCGLYILMLIKILKSFLKLIIIFITTVICFAFSFQHVMRGSNVYPWDDITLNNITLNKSTIRSFAKVSVMMAGEIDANEIINKRELVASVILILFEIIVIIILMNLMLSLAVGDVSELREFAEEKLLHIKINYCIEILRLSKYYPCLRISLNNHQIRNVMIDSEKHKFQFSQKLIYMLPYISVFAPRFVIIPLRISPGYNYREGSVLTFENAMIEGYDETTDSWEFFGSEELKRFLNELENNDGLFDKGKRLLIGLNFQYCSTKICPSISCEH